MQYLLWIDLWFFMLIILSWYQVEKKNYTNLIGSFSHTIISVIILFSIKKCNLLTRWISLPDYLLVQLITNNSSKGKITPRNLVLFDSLFFLFIIALQIIRLLVKISWRMIDFLKYTDEDYLCSKVLDFMMTKRVHKWIKNRVYFFTKTWSDFLKYKI